MIDNSKEYILCAAVRRLDGGFDCGFRHNDVYEKVSQEDVIKVYGIDFYDDMGFLTSKERFVGRKEAWKIALECGQVKPRDYDGTRKRGLDVKDGDFDFLKSEDLY